MNKHTIIAALVSLILLNACSASSSADGSATNSTTSSRITTSLNKAWALAKAGDNPSMPCAQVKGYAISNTSASARAAVAQCNFDIPVRYFNVLLDQVDAGTFTCKEFMTTIATQLRPMTMTTARLQHAFDQAKKGVDVEIADVAASVSTSSTEQASKRVKAELAKRASAACPVLTMYFQS